MIIRATIFGLVSLSLAPMIARAQCLGDFNGDGTVSVSELVTAVGNSLIGCQINGARYVDNGDGTITDNETGLMWEKKDNLDGGPNLDDPHDADNQYTWSTFGTAIDGSAFTDFLGKLNNGAANNIGGPISGCFADHCDWRLPTIVELQGVLDPTQGVCASGTGACIDPAFGPTRVGVYWSATTYTPVPDEALFVPFSNGAGGPGFKTGNSFVRAVRGGS